MYELENVDIKKETLKRIGVEILKHEVLCIHKDKKASVDEIKKIIEGCCNED